MDGLAEITARGVTIEAPRYLTGRPLSVQFVHPRGSRDHGRRRL